MPVHTKTTTMRTVENDPNEQHIHELIKRVNAGCPEARKELINSQLELIQRMARSASDRRMSGDELISEGAIAVSQAAKTFDPSRGIPFAVYATICIKHHFKKAMRHASQTIRVPDSELARRNKLNAASNTIAASTGRAANHQELAQQTGLPVHEVATCMTRAVSHSTSAEYLEQYLSSDASPDGIKPEVKADVEKLLSKVTARERSMISRYFGTLGAPASSIRELAHDFGLAPAAVRGLIESTLRKLRGMSDLAA